MATRSIPSGRSGCFSTPPPACCASGSLPSSRCPRLSAAYWQRIGPYVLGRVDRPEGEKTVDHFDCEVTEFRDDQRRVTVTVTSSAGETSGGRGGLGYVPFLMTCRRVVRYAAGVVQLARLNHLRPRWGPHQRRLAAGRPGRGLRTCSSPADPSVSVLPGRSSQSRRCRASPAGRRLGRAWCRPRCSMAWLGRRRRSAWRRRVASG